MKHKEILKLLFFSIATAVILRYIGISILWERMKITKDNFHKNLINIDTYQQKIAENLYLEIVVTFVLPYVAAILFYFLAKVNLSPKYNFLMFIVIFTILYFSSYFLIGYSHRFLK